MKMNQKDRDKDQDKKTQQKSAYFSEEIIRKSSYQITLS